MSCRSFCLLVCVLASAFGSAQVASRVPGDEFLPDLMPCAEASQINRLNGCVQGCDPGDDLNDSVKVQNFADQYHTYQSADSCRAPGDAIARCSVVVFKRSEQKKLRGWMPSYALYYFPTHIDRWRDSQSWLWVEKESRNFEYNGTSRRIRFMMERERAWKLDENGVPLIDEAELVAVPGTQLGPGLSQRWIAHQPSGKLWELSGAHLLSQNLEALFYEAGDVFRAGGQYSFWIEITNSDYSVVHKTLLNPVRFWMPPMSAEYLNTGAEDVGDFPEGWNGKGATFRVEDDGSNGQYTGPPATTGWWEALFRALFVPSEVQMAMVRNNWEAFATWGPNGLITDLGNIVQGSTVGSQTFETVFVLPDIHVDEATGKLSNEFRPYAPRHSLNEGIELAKEAVSIGPNGLEYSWWNTLRMFLGVSVYVAGALFVVRVLIPRMVL